MKFEPNTTTIVDSIVEFFERLGVCVAVFAGGAAIAHFSDKVLPFCPGIAEIVALLLVFGSLVLSIAVAGSWFANHTGPIRNKPLLVLIAVTVVTTTTFFVLAGGYAAIAALRA